jgi:competence protein ComEC
VYFYFRYSPVHNTITVFDISKPKNSNGSGDFILIRHGKFNILVDTGYGDYSVRKAVLDIQRLKISTIDYLILSHSDIDHVGGVPYILNQSGFNIKKILVSPCMYLNKKSLPITKNIYEVCDNSEIILDNENKITFMSPACSARGRSGNAEALVFLIKTAGYDILFASDIPAKKLKDILHKKGYLDFTNTLVQFPHHCSSRELPGSLFKYSKPLLGFCTRAPTLLKSGVDPSEYEFPVFITGRCGSLDIGLHKNKIKISSQRCSKVYNFI